MSFIRGLTRVYRTGSGFNRSSSFLRRRPDLVLTQKSRSAIEASQEFALGNRVFSSLVSSVLASIEQEALHESSSMVEVGLDPFSIVSDELLIVSNSLRSMVVAEVPKLASSAEYFFKMGVEGKRFQPTVLLLMATAINVATTRLHTELCSRQQCMAEITEMIHVASLVHDDVLDDAETRRGIGSLNCLMGNKFAVLTGDFLLFRAWHILASLGNNEVVTLMTTATKHLVTGETMQMTTTSDQRCRVWHFS